MRCCRHARAGDHHRWTARRGVGGLLLGRPLGPPRRTAGLAAVRGGGADPHHRLAPRAHPAPGPPAGPAHRPHRPPPRVRPGRLVRRAPADEGGVESRADLSRRLRVAAERLGPTYIKLGQIISSGEGLFPEELVDEFKKCRDQVPPEPFADGPRGGRGRPRPAARRGVLAASTAEPLAAASIAQVHAATPAHRRGRSWSRCSGPPVGRAGARRPAGHGVARPVPGRPHPGRGAGQPAGAGRAVRRDDHRGARLPPRGREHARRRPRRSPSSASGATSIPRPHPDAGDPPGAGDGAARRASPSTTWPACKAPASTPRRSCAPGMIGFMEGAHAPRHLPRRPARREPASCCPTAAPRCSTSASPAASTSPAAWPSCACSSAPP